MGLISNLAAYLNDSETYINVGDYIFRLEMDIMAEDYIIIVLGNGQDSDVCFVFENHNDLVSVMTRPERLLFVECLLEFSLNEYIYEKDIYYGMVYNNIPLGEEFNLGRFILDNENWIDMSKVHVEDQEFYDECITVENRDRIIEWLEKEEL